jgi:hypothetical protein
MFCGWELISDYNDLQKLGNGILRIDALNGNCYFNDSQISRLNIGNALRNWLGQECEQNKIDLHLLYKAQLDVDLEFSLIDPTERKYSLGETFNVKGRSQNVCKFHRCKFNCHSLIVTDEKEYKTDYEQVREWPEGWP